MKTKFNLLALAGLALVISACGNTAGTSGTTTASSAGVTTITTVSTDTSTSTSTSTGSAAPLSYEFTLLGTQTAVTPAITTDNVLKVKYRVTANQGNSVHQATELAVTISMNGTEVTPQYTTSNYTYGQVGETSNVIDLSGYLTPGVALQITVKNPKNDFYCTYWGGYYTDGNGQLQLVNPQYNAYPGCRKAVYSTHNWGGVLVVQTSATTAI